MKAMKVAFLSCLCALASSVGWSAVDFSGVTALADRLGGAALTSKVSFTEWEGQSVDKAQIIPGDGAFTIKATSVHSASLALGVYLRDVAKGHVSWCGKRMPTDWALPTATIDVAPRYPHAMAYNYCTLSYTMAYWSKEAWQAEIDRLALSGYTTALCMAGVQKIWKLTMEELGYTKEQQQDFIVDDAQQAWWLMGNLQAQGNATPAGHFPVVSDEEIETDAEIGKFIVAKMREVGVEPVLQGFIGLVPSSTTKAQLVSFLDSNPEVCTKYGITDTSAAVKIFVTGSYNEGHKSPDLVDPNCTMFRVFSDVWNKNLKAAYGMDDEKDYPKFLGGDLFHENSPPSSMTETEKNNCAKFVQKYQQDAFPGVTWVLQNWQSAPVQDLRNGLDPEHTIIQRLDQSMNATDARTASYVNYKMSPAGNIPWVWVEVMNFGGNTGMHGAFRRFRNVGNLGGNAAFKGYGLLSEGLETNPVSYDMYHWAMVQSAQDAQNIDDDELEPWLEAYRLRRYGYTDDNLKAAHTILANTVWTCKQDQQGTMESVFCAKPAYNVTKVSAWGPTTGTPYDRKELIIAAEYFLETAKAHPELLDLETFRYDFVEIFQQILADKAREMLPDCATSQKRRDEFRQMLVLLDSILACSNEWRLDAKEARLVGKAPTTGPSAYRRLITTWTPGTRGQTQLSQYAHRSYAGLVKNNYAVKWNAFFDVTEGTMSQAAYTTLCADIDANFAFADLTTADKKTPVLETLKPVEIAEEILALIAPPAITWTGATDSVWEHANWNDAKGQSAEWENGKSVILSGFNKTMTTDGAITVGNISFTTDMTTPGNVYGGTNGGYVTTDTDLGWTNLTLDELASAKYTGIMSGAWMGGAKLDCPAYHVKKDGDSVTMQFQVVHDSQGVYTKVVAVKLSINDEGHVIGNYLWSKNGKPETLGTEYTSTWSSANGDPNGYQNDVPKYGMICIKRFPASSVTVEGPVAVEGEITLNDGEALALPGATAIDTLSLEKGTATLGLGATQDLAINVALLGSDAKLVLAGSAPTLMGAAGAVKVRLPKSAIEKVVYVGPDGEEQALRLDAEGYLKADFEETTVSQWIPKSAISTGIKGLTLAELAEKGILSAKMDGGYVATSDVSAYCGKLSDDGSTYTVQMQTIDGGFLKVVALEFTVVDGELKVEAKWIRNRSGDPLGTDCTNLSNYTNYGNPDVVTDTSSNGYGIYDLTITPAVARLADGTKFASLTDALAAANGTQKVMLLDDATVTASINNNFATLLEIPRGITLTATCGDFIFWNKAFTLDIYGTLDLGGNALSVGTTKGHTLNLYAGGEIKTTNAKGLAIFDANTAINVKTNSGFETAVLNTPVQARQNTTIAVEEDVTAVLNGNIVLKAGGESGVDNPVVTKTGAGTLEFNGVITTGATLVLSEGTLKRVMPVGDTLVVTVNGGATDISADNADAKIVETVDGAVHTFTCIERPYRYRVTDPDEISVNMPGVNYETLAEAIAAAKASQEANPDAVVMLWVLSQEVETLAQADVAAWNAAEGTEMELFGDGNGIAVRYWNGKPEPEGDYSAEDGENLEAPAPTAISGTDTVWSAAAGGKLTITGAPTTFTGTVTLETASEDGITIGFDHVDATYNYVFTNEGTVKFTAGTVHGTHVVKSLTLDLGTEGAYTKIVSRKLISCTDFQGTISAAPDGITFLNKPAARMRLLALAAEPETSELTNLGDYAFRTAEDGVYIDYVVRSTEPPVEPEKDMLYCFHLEGNTDNAGSAVLNTDFKVTKDGSSYDCFTTIAKFGTQGVGGNSSGAAGTYYVTGTTVGDALVDAGSDWTLTMWVNYNGGSTMWGNAGGFSIGENCFRIQRTNNGTYQLYCSGIPDVLGIGTDNTAAIPGGTTSDWINLVFVFHQATHTLDIYSSGTLWGSVTKDVFAGQALTSISMGTYVLSSIAGGTMTKDTRSYYRAAVDEVAVYNFAANEKQIAWLGENAPAKELGGEEDPEGEFFAYYKSGYIGPETSLQLTKTSGGDALDYTAVSGPWTLVIDENSPDSAQAWCADTVTYNGLPFTIEKIIIRRNFTLKPGVTATLFDNVEIEVAEGCTLTLEKDPKRNLALGAVTLSGEGSVTATNGVDFKSDIVVKGDVSVTLPDDFDRKVVTERDETPMTLYWADYKGTFWEHEGGVDKNGNHGLMRGEDGKTYVHRPNDTVVFDKAHYRQDGAFAEQTDYWHYDENLYIKDEVEPGTSNEWDLKILEGVTLKMGLRGARTTGQNIISKLKIYVEEGSTLELGYWGNTHHYQGVIRDDVVFGGAGAITFGADLGPSLRAEGDIGVKGDAVPTMDLNGKELVLSGANATIGVNLAGFGSLTPTAAGIHVTGAVDFGSAATIDATNAANMLTLDGEVTFGTDLTVKLTSAQVATMPVKVLALGSSATVNMTKTDVRVLVDGQPVAAFYELFTDEAGDLAVRVKETPVVYGASASEGYDFAGGIVTVTMNPAIADLPVTVVVKNARGETVKKDATADWTGSMVVGSEGAGSATVMLGNEDNLLPSGDYTYTVTVGEQEFTGSFYVGNKWFEANPTTGVTGGSWAAVPAVADGKYQLSETATFTVAEDKAAGELGVIEQMVSFDSPVDAATLEAVDLTNAKGAITLAEGENGTPCWKGYVGGAWTVLTTTAPAEPGEHRIRMEYDRTGSGGTMKYYIDGAEASEAFAASGPFASVSYIGSGTLASLEGFVDNPALVEYDGVKYGSMEAAVAAWKAAGKSGVIKLLTNIYFAPEPGTYEINKNGFALYLTNDMTILSENGTTIVVGYPPVVVHYTNGLTLDGEAAPFIIDGEWLGHAIPWKTRRNVQAALLAKPEGSAFTRWQAYVMGFGPEDVETARTTVRGVQTADADKLYVTDGQPVRAAAETGVVVTRVLMSGATPEFVTADAEQPEETADGLPVKLDAIGAGAVRYVKIGYVFEADPGQDAEATGTKTETVSGANTVGILHVDAPQKETILSVPWLGSDGEAVAVADYVKTANLSAGDTLNLYDPKAKKFVTWTMQADGTWVGATRVAADGVAPAAEPTAGLPAGSALVLVRQDPTQPLYLYGSPGAEAPATTVVANAYNLVAPSLARDVNLNDIVMEEAPNPYDVIRLDLGTTLSYKAAKGAAKGGWGVSTYDAEAHKTVFDTTKAVIRAGGGFVYQSRGGAPTFKWSEKKEVGE